MTENLFTVTENILRKKTFIQLLGLRQNVIAGTKWAILSEQYHSILPARVANRRAGFGLFCRSPSLPYSKLSYSNILFVCYGELYDTTPRRTYRLYYTYICFILKSFRHSKVYIIV